MTAPEVAAGQSRLALDVEAIFDGERNAGEGARLGRARLLPGLLGEDRNKSVDLRLHLFDARQVRVNEFGGSDGAARKRRLHLSQGQPG